MNPDIALIIVNYNTGNLLYECLSSIRQHLRSNYEVIAVDNGSGDGSFERCSCFTEDPRFRLIPLHQNLGFARGNNRAVTFSTAPVLHFLNPDTRVDSDLDADYVQVLQYPHAVYINPLVNRDGSIENDRMPVPYLKNIFRWQFHRSRAQYWFKGASVIISRSDFDTVGRWSEDYFMYSEDLDLFYQIWLHHIPIRLLHSVIFHYGGGSSSRTWTSLEREIRVQKSARIFYRKYFSETQYVLVKFYYILHKLFKHPSQVPTEIRAWLQSRQ